MTVDEAKNYIKTNEFAKGSMLPKVEACIEFVENSQKEAIISSLENAGIAFEDNIGTKIVGGK